MLGAALDVAASYSLDQTQASRLWNWVLRGQGLSSTTRYTSVAAIADAALGLHAARLPSPYATVLARSVSPAVALSLFDSHTRSQVTTIRCMRRTLHTLPLDLAAAAHGATVHYRERDARRRITKAGLTERAIAGTIMSIVTLLRNTGALGHRDIEVRVADRSRTVAAVRLALKLAWEQGVLTYHNASAGWNREKRTFAITAATHPRLDMAMDRHRATAHLVDAYFQRYGPASLRDAMWWSGLSRTAILAALGVTGRPLVAVSTPWSAATLYMHLDQLNQFQRTCLDEPMSGLNFLAHEDVALKAYFDTRSRYLAGVSPSRVFNQIGEVLPTITNNGLVVGVWAWDPRIRRISYSLIRGRTDRPLQTRIKARAASMSDALRLGYL